MMESVTGRAGCGLVGRGTSQGGAGEIEPHMGSLYSYIGGTLLLKLTDITVIVLL